MRNLPETAFLALSNISIAFASWVLVALIARSEGLYQVGVYGLALAVFAPIVFALAADARLRIGSGTNQSSVFEMFSLRLVLQLVALVVVVLIVSIFKVSGDVVSMMLAVFCMRAAESNFDFIYGQWVAEKQLKRVAKSQLLRSATSVVVAGVMMTIGFGAAVTLFAITLCQLALLAPSLSACFGSMWQAEGVHFSPGKSIAKLVRTFLLEFRVSVYSALSALNGSMPRYLLAAIGSVESVGLLTIYLQFFAAGTTLSTAVNLAYSRNVGADVKAANKAAAGKKIGAAARGLIFSSFMIGVFMLLGCVLFAPFVLDVIFTVDRSAARLEVGLVMVAALFAYVGVSASSILLYLREVKLLVVWLVAAMVVLITSYLCAISVGYAPLVAVSMAMIANRLFLACMNLFGCRFYVISNVKCTR